MWYQEVRSSGRVPVKRRVLQGVSYRLRGLSLTPSLIRRECLAASLKSQPFLLGLLVETLNISACHAPPETPCAGSFPENMRAHGGWNCRRSVEKRMQGVRLGWLRVSPGH